MSMEMQSLDIHKDGLHNFDHYFIININTNSIYLLIPKDKCIWLESRAYINEEGPTPLTMNM